MEFDTRMNIFLLLDYHIYYGEEKSFIDAQELIKNIPSSTLLNYISGFGVNLYLSEFAEDTGKIQFSLVDSLLGKCGKIAQAKWVSVIESEQENKNTPIMFWSYSNLLFYGLIFKTFNNLDTRDLTEKEAQKVFDAYLIINGIANNRVEVKTDEFQKAIESDKIEDVTMPSFIYQRDYTSTTDFSNQLIRGIKFFQYLENNPKYEKLVQNYYQSKNISGHLRMFRNLLILFTETKIGNDLVQKCQLANLYNYDIANEVDLKFIETLCINAEITNYKADQSFGILRNKFLYKINKYMFLILDINFLIDQLYKAQVFSFNNFLKSKGEKVDFLAEKGKEFTESIFLKDVLEACFPHYVTYYGDYCKNSNNEELCDAYIRENSKICLIEFKDVLLNATAKNSADKETLLAEFNKKFIANQTNRPKGITQLINAIKDIESNSILFDKSIPPKDIEIYPVIIYTDLSFGVEGVNKKFKEKFRIEITKLNIEHLVIKDVTFINLNFFELREDYFSHKFMNLFTMIDEYHLHTTESNYLLTPFEVFSRFYMRNHVPQNLGQTTTYKELLATVIAAK